MNPNASQRPDPFGYWRTLRRAWADTEAGVPGATWRLVLAQGQCLLFDDSEDEMLRPLPKVVVEAAVAEARRLLPGWLEMADKMRGTWEKARDSTEEELCCSRPLTIRMELWAIEEAVHRSYEAGLALAESVDAVDALITDYDVALRKQLDLLSTVVGTGLLEDWKTGLVARHTQALPWWLNGTLERAAERVKVRAEATMPSAESWRAMMRQFAGWVEYLQTRLRPAPVGLGGVPTAAPIPGAKLVWMSPDGRYRAEVRVPDPLSVDQAELPRPLNFKKHPGNEPATDLAGAKVVLGADWPQINEEGRAQIRLCDLIKTATFAVSRDGTTTAWLFQSEIAS